MLKTFFGHFFSFSKLLCILVVYLKIAVQSDDPMLTRVVSLHGGSVDLHVASSALNLELGKGISVKSCDFDSCQKAKYLIHFIMQ